MINLGTRLTRLSAAAILMLGLAGTAGAEEPVTIFAAASLKNALDEVVLAWQAPGERSATVSYAASSALARQTEEGAPADIFISADLDWMSYLRDRNLIVPDTEIRLLSNRLALVAEAGNNVDLDIGPGFPLSEALGGERLAMANVDAVPAGRYGRAALEALGVWAEVAEQVAQAENVRATLMLVALGEAPLGIVYQSDAVAEQAVRVVGLFPEDSHPPIIYPAAATAGGSNPRALHFLDFLQSPEAAGIFEAHGFTAFPAAE